LREEAKSPSFGQSLDLGQMAREEFGLMLRAYFAPVFGTVLVLRQLMQASKQVDQASRAGLNTTPTAPATARG